MATNQVKDATELPNETEVRLNADKPESAATKTKARKKMVSPWRMFRFATSLDYFMMFVGALCACANGGAMAGFSVILGDIFDVLNSGDSAGASMIALRFVWIALGLFVASTLQVGLYTAASERMTIKLRQRYLDALLSQDVAFFDSQDSGALTSKVAENSIMFREALGEKFAAIFQFMSMFIGGMIVGFLYLWQLCLTILALSPLIGFSGYFMAKSLNDVVSGQLESYAAAGAIAEETFTLIRTVTSFGLQKKRISLYEDELEKAAKQTTKQGLAMGWGFGGVMFFYFISYAIAFWVGALLVVNSKNDAESQHPLTPGSPFSWCAVGQPINSSCSPQVKPGQTFETEADVCGCYLCKCGCYYTASAEFTTASTCTTGGDVVLTFFAVLIGSFAIGQSAPSISAFTNGRTAAADLYEVIDRKPAIDGKSEEGLKPQGIKGDIKFENVAFTYPSRLDAPVFKSLNMHIPAGKRVALVGESGSGKSTCIALIERYYDPQNGRVTMDGIDLKDINVKHLRSLIGLVSQEPILFGTTIRENVRFGRPEASDAEVEQACKDANAHSFISSFPDSYNTFVSSSLVSGGQKQRLAIARALLRNPPILLLDEATAALDNESERLVNEAIDRLLSESGARTTIVIAHRLSSIKACEKIIVLEKGQVVEEGSHEELLASTGLYSSLFKLSEGTGTIKRKDNEEATEKVGSPKAKSPKEKSPREGGGGAPTSFLLDEKHEPSSKSAEETNSSAGNDGEKTDVEVTKGCCGRKKIVQKADKSYPIRGAFRYAYPERWIFPFAILAASMNGLTFPVFALLFANLIDTFFYPNSSAILNAAALWCLAFFGLACGNAIAIFFQNVLFQYINGQMTKRVRSAVFEHIISQEMGFFDEKSNSVGTLASKLASDAAMVRAAISDRLAVGTMNLATMIAGFIIAFIASWQVSLVVFAMFPAIVVAGAVQMLVMSGLANSDQKALEKASHTLSESVAGVRTVAAFNMQPSVQKLYYEQLKGPLALSMRKGVVGGLGFGFSQAVMFFAYALTFWYGSRLVNDGTISFRDLNQALFGILMTAMAMGQNVAIAPDISKGQAAVNSIFRLLDRKSKINPLAEDGQKPSVLIGDLAFENIQFAYPTRPNITVLQSFNLNIKRGQTVAFVGTSGSGKSTLVLLLERFYDPLNGFVRVDGVDVRDLNVEWLRSQIGIVSQEPAMFKGTIMENIRSGRTEATDEEVIEAAKMANAHDFITKFPQGYQTDIQQQSGTSGGQKQRIAIARALVRNPKILLLDEATSALDEESQKVVQQALDNLLEQSSRTTIVVAHRLSTIRNADVIVVLQSGVVVEQGSFEELAKKPNGAFQSLLHAQAKTHGE